MFGIREAAKRAGITETLLALWVETGRVKPLELLSTKHVKFPGLDSGEELFGVGRFAFTIEDIEQLRRMAEGKEKPARRRTQEAPADPELLTVQQVAERWGLSRDTIRRLFADEPGVVVVGKTTRGKRKRSTMRIPKEVMDRVKRKRALR